MDDGKAMLESANLHEKVRCDCSRSAVELAPEWTLERSRLWRLTSPWFGRERLIVPGCVLKSADRMRTAALDQASVLLPPEFDALWPELLSLLLGKTIFSDN